MNTQINKLFNLARWKKRLLMVATDLIILPFSVWLAYALRFNTLTPELNSSAVALILMVTPITMIIFVRLGLYRSIIRFLGNQAITAVFLGVSIASIMLLMFDLLVSLGDQTLLGHVPKSIYIIQWGVALLLIGSSRYFIRRSYQTLQAEPKRTPVLIYGAGYSGAQLAYTLLSSREFRPVAFVDDNPSLDKSIIHGLRIHHTKHLKELLSSQHKIQQILLAMPSISQTQKRDILNELEQYRTHVRSIPNINDLLSGKRNIDELQEISIEELLGRDSVDPDYHLLVKHIQTKNVMVTGAGGSIGSELCRQIIVLNPKRLVLFEICEYALYRIEQELQQLMQKSGYQIELIPTLGSVQEAQHVHEIIQHNQIDTLYHAAAYKHVPLVEHNPIQGLQNNILGTWRTAKAAMEAQVSHFVLISTDKAVRPTNVMGASKRMAELCLQALAKQTQTTTFSMVRFGNVLGSSGSVVPLFRKQIRQGGPVTITHPEITRYFMTIPEAAQLVIQAGSMAKGGEVFLLDMGESVKIIDLAKRMIRLSGLTERTQDNPQGDIELAYSGLRPGEKLYEELLIEPDSVQKTPHPRIHRGQEDSLDFITVQRVIHELEVACQSRDLQTLYRLLKTHVRGFKPSHLPEVLQQSTSEEKTPFKLADVVSITKLANQ